MNSLCEQAASGFIYPLERGLIFIYKPPIFVKYEDVQSINFARYILKCWFAKTLSKLFF